MDSRTKTNRGLWDGWAALLARSAFYDVARFRDGKSRLEATELAEVGPVDGKRLLHLQCHLAPGGSLHRIEFHPLAAVPVPLMFTIKASAPAEG
jgi:hypothetical protein